MTRRELKVLFLEIFYPTLLIIISSIILALSTGSYDKLHRLDTSLIPKSQIVYYSYNTSNIGQDPTVADNFMSHYYDKGKFSKRLVEKSFQRDRSWSGDNRFQWIFVQWKNSRQILFWSLSKR